MELLEDKTFLLAVRFFCSQSTGKRFAMKTVKKQPIFLKYVQTEAEILRNIRHVSYCVLIVPPTKFSLMSPF